MADKIFVAITGGRAYGNYRHVKRVLDEERPGVVVQGECPYGGADRLAKRWCKENGVPCIGMEALWDYYGNSAGPMRNGWMLDLLPIYKLIAFPGDRAEQQMPSSRHMREKSSFGTNAPRKWMVAEWPRPERARGGARPARSSRQATMRPTLVTLHPTAVRIEYDYRDRLVESRSSSRNGSLGSNVTRGTEGSLAGAARELRPWHDHTLRARRPRL